MIKKIEDYGKFVSELLSSKHEKTITFETGGTTSEKKLIKKSLENLIREAKDIFEELNITGDLEFISTTTPEHLFGFVYHYVFPSVYGYKIREERINYPEDINVENAVLITTPSFLEAMHKYDAFPRINPKIIIAAGSKLHDETFRYAQTISERVIEIYGSTETGTIAYRTSADTHKLKLFKGIEIISADKDKTVLSTEYSCEKIQTIGDRIKVQGREIEIEGRSDRILKIQEKRISALELEEEICKNDLVRECYCFEYGGKIGMIAALSKEGQEFIIKQGSPEIIKNIKSKLNNKFEVIPQRFRFIDEIPKTISGKINRKNILEIFDLNLSFPLILERNITGGFAEFELCFLRNSNFFQGHFEGFPILPGVVQLFWANYFTKLAFGIDCRCGQIRKIKFSNIIRPDKPVTLQLIKSETGVNYKYEDISTVYSSGILPQKNFLQDKEEVL